VSEPSILVLEDDYALSRILSRLLTAEAFAVDTMHSVTGAVHSINQKQYDAYVLDYLLPDGSGFDVAERVRKSGSSAPIIIITGYDSKEISSRGRSLKVAGLIRKPFSPTAIATAVRAAFGPQLQSAHPSHRVSQASPVVDAAIDVPQSRADLWAGLLLVLCLLALLAYLLLA
jgi:two-component system response regulator HydG